jgi:hypothetical protein
MFGSTHKHTDNKGITNAALIQHGEHRKQKYGGAQTDTNFLTKLRRIRRDEQPQINTQTDSKAIS